ncbi:MAG: hypothetical protein TQ35_0008145 [Candidatus Aramenus sulfurataquae]|jgi:hypothetical protein|uniref:Uncharacterized protein n=2 Tax=Candidatus Aramenus sulfurataquae TaxID=1326980 RepID=A0A0F2LJZ7_9CREN|nr:hypothetical protein [Candidatus Aramenus sulfurataquae]
MLVKVRLKGEVVYPAEVKGRLAYLKNVILIIRAQGRPLFVDYVDKNLASYEPPFFLSGKVFYYEVIEVPEEYVPFLKCIARQVEEEVKPLYKNKKLGCRDEVTVVVEK